MIQPTLTTQNSNTGMEGTKFHIFAKNAHVHSQTKFAELLLELADIEWDIILFSETRYAGGNIVLEGGHHMFASSEPTVAAGVAVLVHCKHVRNIKFSQAPSSRICFVDMMMKAGVTRFVATYTPHMGYSNHDLYRYYDQLAWVLDDARRQGRTIVLGGDFNTQLNVGIRGDCLADLAKNFDGHHDPNKATWTFCSCMGVRRRIDFILCSMSFSLLQSFATDDVDLGSDHRAVYCLLNLPKHTKQQSKKRKFKAKKRWKPSLDENGIPHLYHEILNQTLEQQNPTTLQGIESLILNAVEQEKQTLVSGDAKATKFWEDPNFQQLLQQRRGSQCRHERMEASKQIRKHIRKHLRERRNLRTERILAEFVQLDRLDDVHHDPAKPHKRSNAEQQPTPQMFAEYLQDIFALDFPASNLQPYVRNGDEGANVPLFSMGELDYVLTKMKNGRCADSDGLFAEMFKYASIETKLCLLDLFNASLKTGQLELSWRHSEFVMLPKSGNLSETNNWRPIAILKITYKIFSSLLHLRLRRQLDYQQSVDQVGFRPKTGVDHAFVVLEAIIGKTLEWQCGIWFASLDLRKAFDKVEHGALFAALTAQGIRDGYLDLLMAMYQDQTGAVPGSENFSIQRGVRQGDVLSPLLFNAVLEHAMRKWKLKLTNEGLRLGQDTRLTNLRYADDLMIFATSREELVFMVETLAEELSLIGLQLNGTKTKVLTTSTSQEASHVEICGTMVAILQGEMTHKYLGRKFPGNLNSRTEVELMYRIQCAWGKFHQHKLILLNKHVSLRLRLKLFHATVSPTAMFGLASLPLTQRFLHKLDVVQRRMLRSIVGWVRIPDEPWENTMRRMNQRMEHAAYLHPLPSWSNQYFKSQYRLATKIVSNQFSWAATAVAWMPLDDWVHNFPSAPSRSRGRPPKRWDQALASFSCTYFGERNWWVAAQNCNQWLAAEAAFVKYCESM